MPDKRDGNHSLERSKQNENQAFIDAPRQSPQVARTVADVGIPADGLLKTPQVRACDRRRPAVWTSPAGGGCGIRRQSPSASGGIPPTCARSRYAGPRPYLSAGAGWPGACCPAATHPLRHQDARAHRCRRLRFIAPAFQSCGRAVGAVVGRRILAFAAPCRERMPSTGQRRQFALNIAF